jgi:hypothetical protein
MSMNKARICLTMIVKDETKVIRQALESMKPFVDSWCIVDTGSTDGTQDLVKEVMADKPGELFERPWVNFAHNRTEALQLAKSWGDYCLFQDADARLTAEPDFRWPELTADGYHVRIMLGSTVYTQVLLFKSTAPWEYRGVLHEYACCPGEATIGGIIGGIMTIVATSDVRGKGPEVYRKHADILLEEHKKDPRDARTVFYLAQSYRDGLMPAEAHASYKKRVEMGGWDEEVFIARLECAKLKEQFIPYGLTTIRDVLMAYLDAYEFRPTRAESLWYLAQFLEKRGRKALSEAFFAAASKIPMVRDILFVQTHCYSQGLNEGTRKEELKKKLQEAIATPVASSVESFVVPEGIAQKFARMESAISVVLRFWDELK